MSPLLLSGKVPPKSLVKAVFKYLGISDERIILGPAIGEDAAIIKVKEKTLALTTDPITGATENIGWLSVHINANDIATRGVKPLWYLCCILLPERKNEGLLKNIMKQIDKASKELGIAVVGGHSEVTLGLRRPIVIGFMMGECEKGKYVTSSGAKVGDKIILTKTAGIEGTAILANELNEFLKKKINPRILKRAKGFIKKVSVVKDALVAMKAGGVSAIHDPTEGGVFSGLWELAKASRVGLIAREDRIPVSFETKTICDVLKLDPLKIMSSGALLITTKKEKSEEVLSALKGNEVQASIIGEIVELKRGRKLMKRNGRAIEIKPCFRDELYVALENYGKNKHEFLIY
ncbi:MAG: AIR synthase family protein [Candidatus Bathyarchaeia archaeon]